MGWHLRDVKANNNGGYGIYAGAGTEGTLENVEAQGNALGGIYLEGANVLADLDRTIRERIGDTEVQARLLSVVETLVESQTSPKAFHSALDDFMRTASPYMTVLGPFVGPLRDMLSRLGG